MTLPIYRGSASGKITSMSSPIAGSFIPNVVQSKVLRLTHDFLSLDYSYGIGITGKRIGHYYSDPVGLDRIRPIVQIVARAHHETICACLIRPVVQRIRPQPCHDPIWENQL